MGWSIYYKMAAFRKYDGKDKFDCHNYFVPK